jgi:hypothetical protein
MFNSFTMTAPPSGARCFLLAIVVLAALTLSERQAHAQGNDSLVNGAVIGAAVGAGAGVAFTHAVRDSDLGFGQYAYGALVFGALGAGAGSADALLNRVSRAPRGTPRRILIAPTIWRDVAAVVVKWRWSPRK